MDYQKIILQGYYDEFNREYLEKYFIREFKKAEKEFFEADDFFNGCLSVVKGLENHIKHMFNDRRNILELRHKQAKNGLLQYENMEGKTIEQKRKETIEFCEQELVSLSENDFPIPLPQITEGRLSGNMYKKDLLQIKLSIENAFQKQVSHQNPYSVLEWATIFYYADETNLLSDSNLKKERMKQFMSKHNIATTYKYFKTKYYEANKRINKKNDYPIDKLEFIISFLRENYKQTVTKVENDISLLEGERAEY